MGRRLSAIAAALWTLTATATPAAAPPVAVRYVEGAAHGFLRLRDGRGKTLAEGDWWQIPKGERVEITLKFRPDDVYGTGMLAVLLRNVGPDEGFTAQTRARSVRTAPSGVSTSSVPPFRDRIRPPWPTPFASISGCREPRRCPTS